jgi:hypothetical protein
MNDALTHAKEKYTQAWASLGIADHARRKDDQDRIAKAAALEALKVSHDGHIVEGAEAQTLAEHDAAVASAMSSKAAILRAEIELDFANTKAARSRSILADAVETSRTTYQKLREAAIAVADAEDIELAQRCEASRMAYAELCKQLRARTLSGVDVPMGGERSGLKAVTEAFDHMPARDMFHTPISEQFKQCTFQEWNARVEKIIGGPAA